ncbi:cyclic nucleotide-binding domain-containing protein [Fulvivirgaceae bacterium BMA12]|uniref:Cyclic nucleotide-binding domain-containing protein n=1 Tax=Agaribacillus aureus TaxID=3051825 RepID=A0ABT8L1J4_9BACT|nr:cyclic nucleotide-binding domain-containing protein [Fulvivirgaceae bacterium BMA12]
MKKILQWIGDVRLNDCDTDKILYHEGDRAERVFVLKSGSIHIYKKNSKNQNRLIHKIYPGEIFGISSLLKQACYHVTAKSRTPVTYWHFSSCDLFNFLQNNPDQRLYFTRKLASRMTLIELGLGC